MIADESEMSLLLGNDTKDILPGCYEENKAMHTVDILELTMSTKICRYSITACSTLVPLPVQVSVFATFCGEKVV